MYKPTTQIFTSKLPRLNLELLREYRETYQRPVVKRLAEFKALRQESGERIFYELCYCILTPQSSGLVCDGVVAGLVKNGVLRDPVSRQGELERALKKTRFWKNKTSYIIKAWERFAADGMDNILNVVSGMERELGDVRELRNNLRKEMRGMGIGMKEASHFLRNIGRASDLAIIDRHIMRCFCELGVIEDEEKILKSEKEYLNMEVLMADFSSDVGMPLEELDLLFWSAKTGYIFK